MPLDPYVKRFLDRLNAMSPVPAADQSIGERRSSVQQLMSLSRSADVAAVEDSALSGPAGALRIRVYTPHGSTTDTLPGLIYFHGGGLVAGSVDTHDPICRALAHCSGWRIVSVDYRLAPEHRFPAAIEDGMAAASWAHSHAAELGIDRARLGIGGDSAGATLATVVCQASHCDGRMRFALQFLLCPIMDFLAATESRRTLAQGYFLEEGTLRHDLQHYLGPNVDPASPSVSPLRAQSLEGLPPTCVHTAEFDPLRD